MKSTKTILAIAIVIVGFAYAVGAGHPQIDSLKHSHRCCGPQPEDLRSYHISGSGVIVPSVEGENGMIITDVVCDASACVLYIAGEPTTTIIIVDTLDGAPTASVHFESGLPVPAGTELTASLAFSGAFVISGYVY